MNQLAKSLCLIIAIATLPVGRQAYAAPDRPVATASKPLPKEIPLAGKVVETMNGGGYTYLLLQGNKEKVWVAVPLMEVTVGQKLALIPGFEMKNFNSKGLNRTFDRVVFSAGVANNQGVKLSPAAIKKAHEGVPAGAPSSKSAEKAPVAKNKPAMVNIKQIKKATGPNAYTIAQLYAKKMNLEKKSIVVRGKVVKVSSGIMKRNWVHIQDGSGSAAKKNNDLVITTSDLPEIGDVVTARGTLYNNLDFGSGYRYSLLIEKARLK